MINPLVSGITSAGAALAAAGWAYRRGRQRQVARALAIDTPGGIVEQRFVRIGGIDQ
jgi:hypothetical protein